MVTGRYQERYGVNSIPDTPLPLEAITVAERLKPAGYISGMVGKWHLDVGPVSEGWFKANRPDIRTKPAGPLSGAQRCAPEPHFTICRASMIASRARCKIIWRTTICRAIISHCNQVATKDYRLDVQTDAALAFLKRRHDKPFYLYLNYYGPHVPLDAPPKYLDRFPGPMPERRRYALAMISAIDDGVGKILAALRDYGIEKNTLVVFTSDNGAPLKLTMADNKPITANGWDGSRNDPMRGEKGMLTEGGMRVPMVMQWKGMIPPGQIYTKPMISLDVAAMANSMAGLPDAPELDGVNLLPYLTGQKKGEPDRALFWRFWNQGAVRRGDWKYLRLSDKAEYLFDINKDPEETTNLAPQNPAIVARLHKELDAWAAPLKPPGVADTGANGQELGFYNFWLNAHLATPEEKKQNGADEG